MPMKACLAAPADRDCDPYASIGADTTMIL